MMITWLASTGCRKGAIRFVGRGFSRDIFPLFSSGVLTPECMQHFFGNLLRNQQQFSRRFSRFQIPMRLLRIPQRIDMLDPQFQFPL